LDIGDKKSNIDASLFIANKMFQINDPKTGKGMYVVYVPAEVVQKLPSTDI
jgi:hypothetical protein